MWFGKQAEVAVPNTIGYIHIYAFIGISVMSFITAKVGARSGTFVIASDVEKMFCLLADHRWLLFCISGYASIFLS